MWFVVINRLNKEVLFLNVGIKGVWDLEEWEKYLIDWMNGIGLVLCW